MSKYVKKRITIILVFLIILAVIAGTVYLLVRPKLPTCFDGIQNQGEAGVDCGDPCSPCPWQLRKDLEVISTEAIETQSNYVDLVAKIKNPNQDFGVEPFSYSFNLYDSAGSLIDSKQGSSYILPQETKHIIEQRVLVDSKISNIEFKVIDVNWQELVDYEEPELFIRNPEFSQSENISLLSSTLENRSNYDFSEINIRVILLDKKSNILGVGKIELRTVLSKESRYFEISWSFPIDGKVDRAGVAATTNVFLDENFMRSYGGDRARFQEY